MFPQIDEAVRGPSCPAPTLGPSLLSFPTPFLAALLTLPVHPVSHSVWEAGSMYLFWEQTACSQHCRV